MVLVLILDSSPSFPFEYLDFEEVSVMLASKGCKCPRWDAPGGTILPALPRHGTMYGVPVLMSSEMDEGPFYALMKCHQQQCPHFFLSVPRSLFSTSSSFELHSPFQAFEPPTRYMNVSNQVSLLTYSCKMSVI